MAVRVFISTKFTDPDSPQRLSVGMVSEAGHEFYAELDLENSIGKMRLAASTEFVREHVLGQWGHESGASCSDTGLGVRPAIWLHRLSEHVGQDIELVYAEKVNADLLERALQHSNKWWPRVERRVRWSFFSEIRADQFVKGSEDKSWAHSLELIVIGQHHALADARALKASFTVVHSVGAEPKALQPGFMASAARERRARSGNLLTALVEMLKQNSVERVGLASAEHGANAGEGTTEAGVAEAVASERSQKWLADNDEAIKSSNAFVETHGLPLSRYTPLPVEQLNFPTEEWMQTARALADGILKLVTESGELSANSMSGLQELRRFAEKVRGA
jgi:hypothetical protein